MLARRAQRGELARLAPGTYVSTQRWLLLSRQDRRRVTAVAFSDSRRRPVTFCGVTALELLGYPVVEQAPLLHVRAAHRGDSGTTPQVSPYVNEKAVLRTVTELSTQGLMKGDGRVPVLPHVQRHWNAPGAAMAMVFGNAPLSTGTAPADAIKRRHGDAEIVAGQARSLLRTEAQRLRFDAQWRFADSRSESAGESLSRAIIHDMGFVVPDLQFEARTETGELLARTDFYWDEIRLTAEFDGLVKYTGRLAQPGATGPVGQDALVREKRREDAVRRQGYGMAGLPRLARSLR